MLDQGHNVVVEPRHVLAHYEGRVASVYLLVVHDGAADRVASPLSVFLICQCVHVTDEHRDWDRGNVLNRDQVSLAFGSNIQESVIVGCPNLEAGLFQVLSVVKNRLG